MGMRYITRLFKPGGKHSIEEAVLNAAATIGVYAKETEKPKKGLLLTIGKKAGVYTADLPDCEGESYFFQELAVQLGGVWLEARIQEGSHWDYTLSYPGYVLDNFSTLPNYFEEDEFNAVLQKGRPEVLAKGWEVPLESIERYIVPWDDAQAEDELVKGKAYPTDKYEYGNYDQVFDFLKKLHYTTDVKWRFELRFPEMNYSPKRHFLQDLSVKSPKRK